MPLNYLAFAIPLFLGFMALEYALTLRQGKRYFDFSDSAANLNVGIAERLLDVFVAGLAFFFYDFLHKNYGWLSIRPNVATWLLLLLATDFVWYWYHRLAHEINVFWAVHVVHHQSEEFNYTVSARITVLQAAVRTGFWAVLPLLGFPAPMISSVLLVHGLYPFFIHTRAIGKLGFWESILVTPSHHRVHHASNGPYLDKNYGDVLIIWDKLFGTFAEERADEEPVYGLVHPLKSHSFLWQHFHFVLELTEAVRRQPGFGDKLRLIFGRPELIPADIRPALERRFLVQGSRPPINRRVRRYVRVQLVVALSLLFGFLLVETAVSMALDWAVSAFILLTLMNVGAVLELRSWVFHLEFLRTAVVFLAAYAYLGDPAILYTLLLLGSVSILFFTSLRRQYFGLVYGPFHAHRSLSTR